MFRRPDKPLTPDEVYASSLESLGLGYPLWCPEPHISGEPQVADVGFLHEGKFIRLFNLDKASPEKAVTRHKPPYTDITSFPPNALQINPTPNLLSAGHYCSRGVRSSNVRGSVTVSVGPSESVALKADYTCHEAQGAALTLQSAASAEGMLPSTVLKEYLLQQVETWHAYATQVLCIDIKMEDVVVVIGWIKTTPDWAATAFGFDKHTGGSISLGANAAGAAGAEASSSKSSSVKTSSIQRHGPLYSPNSHAPRTLADDVRSNQCVFIKRLSVKKRFILPGRIVGGAGSHHLPGSQGGRGSYEEARVFSAGEDKAGNVEYGWTEHTDDGRSSSSLDIIQEYIFEVSDANTALVSDDEVECILCGEHVVDLASWLRKAAFEVTVSANGIGSLRMEDVICHQQEHKFAHPPITAADTAAWPEITRQAAGSLMNSQILLEPTEAKAHPVAYKHVVFGDTETMKINLPISVSLSTDGKLLAAATGDTITIWRLQDGLTVQRLERDGHTDSIEQIDFSPDGRHIVSGADDKLALVWDVKTGNIMHRLEGHKQDVKYATFSPDGTQIATRSNDSLQIWSASSGGLLYAVTDLEPWSGGKIDFSPDGSRLTAHSDASQKDKAVVVLDCRTGEHIATLRKPYISCMAFSSEGDRIVTGYEDGSACVWDAASGKALLELKEHTDDVNQVAFSPDGSEVATASDNGTVVTCDSHTGERRFTFRVESVRGWDKKRVLAVAYSPRNEFIACGAQDGCVRVWNRRTGAVIAAFQGHSAFVLRVMFMPDGWDILSYGVDNVVRLWSIRDALRLS
ncbi:WD40 repeat domain-containing protein [Phanerochaete sordida]|uniref:WD40 repeat domain-containing protein n=1 Tax=Phanerochaete sordida TaxID=48140 RepID=A0A9P3LL47_9APHY|nr:WD40 repeat domain-containing protein [Phanerochaete sordida]